MLDFLIITAVICILFVWIQSRPFIWKGKGIKWMVPLPLFGNTAKTLVSSWPDFWLEFYASLKGDGIFGFHFFSTPALIIKDPVLLKKILISDADHFSSREFERIEEDPMGHSLFFENGLTWKNQRTKLTPYFTPTRIRATLSTIQPITDKLVQYVDQEIRKGPVDAYSTSIKYATDVIMSNVFGLEPESFDNPNSFFISLQKELVSFSTGLRGMINIMMPNVYSMLKLTFLEKGTIKKLSMFVSDVLAQRSQGIGVRPDFMQGMVDLWDKKELSNRSYTAAKKIEPTLETGFDKKTVIGQCMIMYFAGTETTGSTLTYALYELALNQNVQDRLRDEIKAMVSTTNGEYGMDDIHKLKYMGQVISETLRRYTVAGVIGRKCTSPYNLDGLEIPVGTVIMIPLVAIHRDPKYFPDPMKFDPDRFSPDASKSPDTFLPFGQGPRICIGMKFAETEIRLAFCKLLLEFKILPCNKTPVPIRFARNPTLNPSGPVWLDFERLE